MQASIDNHLAKQSNLPMPTEFNIPLAGQVEGTATSMILLPHEMMHHLWESTTGWVTSIMPDAEALPRFWGSFSGHPCMENHPVKKSGDYMEKAVPLAMHGDEVPVFGVGKIWARSGLAFSWLSLLATAAGRSAADCNLYVWGVFEKFLIPEGNEVIGTMQVFWQIMHWSFSIIYTGKWPSRDWQGKKRLGGFVYELFIHVRTLAILSCKPSSFS